MSYTKNMKVRLSSHLTRLEFKDSTAPSPRKSGGCKPLSKIRTKHWHSDKERTPEQIVWEALWAALVVSDSYNDLDVSSMRGSFYLRDWVARSSRRTVGYVVSVLKEELNRLRAISLGSDPPPIAHGFPKKLDTFLQKVFTPLGLFAFSGVSRGFPTCVDKVKVSETLVDHMVNVATPAPAVPINFLRSIEQFVPRYIQKSVRYDRKLAGKMHDPSPVVCKSSPSACYENPRGAGGFYAYIKKLGDKISEGQNDLLADIRAGAKPRPEDICHPILRGIAKASYDPDRTQDLLSPKEMSSILDHFYFYSGCNEYLNNPDKDVIHRVAVIPERGYKNRVVTAPPASILSMGEVVRSSVFPYVKAHPSCDVVKDGDMPVVCFPAVDGAKLVSADLTKATDGFSHDVIRSVGVGLRNAGFPQHVVDFFVDTLGAGDKPHYAEYDVHTILRRHSKNTVKYDRLCGFLQSYGWDGHSSKVKVPMLRGSPMGTPCSFTLLCIINSWALDHCSNGPKICGDDMLAYITAKEFSKYKVRVAAIGSGVHPLKTFISPYAGTFCENIYIKDPCDSEFPSVVAFGRAIKCPIKAMLYPQKGSNGRIDWPDEIVHQVFTGETRMSKEKVRLSSFTDEPEYHVQRKFEAGPGDFGYNDCPSVFRLGRKVRRVLRTLRRDQIRSALKKGRYPWLPACLGGLNYPRRNPKGVMGLSGLCRARLFQFTHSDLSVVELGKFMSTLDNAKRPLPEHRELEFISDMVADAEINDAIVEDTLEKQGECSFVDSYSLARHQGSVRSNFFRSMGGKLDLSASSYSIFNAARIRWPAVKGELGTYVKRTPFSLIIQDLDNLLRAPRYRVLSSFAEKLPGVEHPKSNRWHHLHGAGGWNDGIL
nr:putative RNA-dependent RNA polymerase [Puccinia striiformis virus 5]